MWCAGPVDTLKNLASGKVQQRTSDLETTGSGSGWQREGRYGEYGSTRPCQMQSPGKEVTGQSEPLRPEQLRT